MLTRLKQVNEFDDVGVLAHFQDFDLPTLLEDFDWLHVGLGDGLDRNLHAVLLMLAELDDAELALAQVRRQIVVVVDVELADDLSDGFDPSKLVIGVGEVQNSGLVWWQDHFNWV